MTYRNFRISSNGSNAQFRNLRSNNRKIFYLLRRIHRSDPQTPNGTLPREVFQKKRLPRWGSFFIFIVVIMILVLPLIIPGKVVGVHDRIVHLDTKQGLKARMRGFQDRSRLGGRALQVAQVGQNVDRKLALDLRPCVTWHHLGKS